MDSKIRKIVEWQPDFPPAAGGLPSVFYIEAALACNLRCPECAIGARDITERRLGLMSKTTFDTINQKIKHLAKLVYLHKWGESTMNPLLPYMVSKVSEYAHTHISTNGTLLKKSMISDLFNSGLGTLIFSIDGTTQEVYEKYRVGGKLSRVMENLRLANEIKKVLDAPVKILPMFIVFEHNVHQLNEFIDMAKELDMQPVIRAPYIRFKTGIVSRVPELQQTLKSGTPEIYTSKDAHSRAVAKCKFAHNTLCIGSDGEVLFCSQDYNLTFGSAGNLADNKQTVKSIWHSELHTKLRKQMTSLSTPKFCQSSCTEIPLEEDIT